MIFTLSLLRIASPYSEIVVPSILSSFEIVSSPESTSNICAISAVGYVVIVPAAIDTV